MEGRTGEETTTLRRVGGKRLGKPDQYRHVQYLALDARGPFRERRNFSRKVPAREPPACRGSCIDYAGIPCGYTNTPESGKNSLARTGDGLALSTLLRLVKRLPGQRRTEA